MSDVSKAACDLCEEGLSSGIHAAAAAAGHAAAGHAAAGHAAGAMGQQMMAAGHAAATVHQAAQSATHGLGAGAAMATTAAGRGLLRTVFGNPWVTLAIGAAAGYLGYKYRKEIAAAVMNASEMGKDFVLQQKESLSDIAAEAREAAEEQGGGNGQEG
ncbi:MAG: hypothetical protein PHF72_00925 [Gammaproteobacteria bacterium]|nr:hypothetical protein [Gammaproteobacteria bacterium]